MAEAMEVPFLGSVPLDPMLRMSCDSGKSFMEECPQSPASQALAGIVKGMYLIMVFVL